MDYLLNLSLFMLGFLSGLGIACYYQYRNELSLLLTTIKEDIVSLHVRLDKLIDPKV
jgi:hypothetical protein